MYVDQKCYDVELCSRHFLILYTSTNCFLFQESIVCAKDWEKRLENLCRLWKIHQQKENGVENWLQQATAILQEKTDDPETSIKRHKAFFGKQNNKILEDFLRAGQDILDVLEKPDQAELQKSMDDIKTRWKVHYLYHRSEGVAVMLFYHCVSVCVSVCYKFSSRFLSNY